MSKRIELRGRDGSLRGFTIVSDQDYERCINRRWHLSNHGYVVGKTKEGRNEPMHRFILGLEFGDGWQVDHVNGDRLDNRRSNLRRVTGAQNMQNIRNKRRNKLGLTGVVKQSHTKRFRAVAGGRHIGYFDTPELAAAAVRDWKARNYPYSPEAMEAA